MLRIKMSLKLYSAMVCQWDHIPLNLCWFSVEADYPCIVLPTYWTSSKPFSIYIILLSTHSAEQCPLTVPFT